LIYEVLSFKFFKTKLYVSAPQHELNAKKIQSTRQRFMLN